MLIDFHTHSLHVENQNGLRFVVGKNSLGIHPWELTAPFDENLYQKKFQQLKKQLYASILAIGECGLDRRRDGIASIEIQTRVLEWHMDWAKEMNRPIIIHCVKAHSDLLKILKDKKYKGRILLHDYAGSVEESKKFLSYDCYFSFGHKLFTQARAEVFKSLPVERLFLETDDQHKIKIEVLYEKAQELLNIDQKNFEVIIEGNLAEFFSDLDNIGTADIINNLGSS